MLLFLLPQSLKESDMLSILWSGVQLFLAGFLVILVAAKPGRKRLQFRSLVII